MTKNDIIKYVMNTPHNTNPAILFQMLDEFAVGNRVDDQEEMIIFTSPVVNDESEDRFVITSVPINIVRKKEFGGLGSVIINLLNNPSNTLAEICFYYFHVELIKDEPTYVLYLITDPIYESIINVLRYIPVIEDGEDTTNTWVLDACNTYSEDSDDNSFANDPPFIIDDVSGD